MRPVIKRVKLRQAEAGPELIIKGKGFITNDAVIEVNGVALEEIGYPVEFQQEGGTTRRVVSRDRRLGELIQPGRTVQVTVFNSLTNVRSEAVTFTR